MPYATDIEVNYQTYFGVTLVVFVLTLVISCAFYCETTSRTQSKVSFSMLSVILILVVPMTLLGIQQANVNDAIPTTESYVENMDMISWANCTYGVDTYTYFSRTR
jgi:hypothetical protein